MGALVRSLSSPMFNLLRWLVLMAGSVEKPVSHRHGVEEGITNLIACFDKTRFQPSSVCRQFKTNKSCRITLQNNS